ncbi:MULTISPECIES: NAD(P)/FAD-dependent oxidoreductase [unclassified Rathayibacter]|uniref:NAD(P)/FAD-dependent oxidoreductase n=1 Tax=unclassified Rathayibacter TaxID=2609250 RepID=UPI00188A0CB5|nr:MULTISPECIES: NAD(P)/FAD-dependent oxidoreductase [unclassified Rathayibacter]MBF4461223.1 NAD(P)/FAD-dependent oxidoreductase [Rathayibacter sp. VKM Ac-2879]MBF4502634.1 NAD(P)/FAD-dependent oxidoreductase [Rathayibacter sp. VKM Ac-2878]
MSATAVIDALIVGGGPAGLAAAVNLGRARSTVLVVDADRPRNAATLRSHGFPTRDGLPPHEIRRLARAELEAYPDVRLLVRARVAALSSVVADDGARFVASIETPAGVATVRARSVLLATGLSETLPDVPGLRGFYGMSLFSCVVCDGWELRDRPLALIGETPDLADRARLVARWSARLTVFTHGSAAIDAREERELARAGIAVARGKIAALEGDKGEVEAVRLVDGSRVEVGGGFVRPLWRSTVTSIIDFRLDVDADGLVRVDSTGRTSVKGVFAAGDVAGGPQQLVVAAGQGARVAAVLLHELVVEPPQLTAPALVGVPSGGASRAVR